MIYRELIKVIQQHQTPRVRALSLENSCSTDKIPNELISLIPNLIQLLDTHIDQICRSNHLLAFFGLQMCAMTIKSEYPKVTNRIINRAEPNTHLCCSVQFLELPEKTLNPIDTWQETKTLIIDFTTGILMDNVYYLSGFMNLAQRGVLYNTLDRDQLNKTWEKITNHQSLLRGKHYYDVSFKTGTCG